jgi:hypothetical protein
MFTFTLTTANFGKAPTSMADCSKIPVATCSITGAVRLKDAIHYSIGESATGGRVIIHSDNQDAVAAVHKFLIFQIEEHKTGDATEIR